MIDVAIVGAGPVGATLAALLGGVGRSARLFEAKGAPAADTRTLALSAASREILEGVGGWPVRSTAITSIHVSQLGGFGRTLIEAADQGLPALGHTVSYGDLEAALHAAARGCGVAIEFGSACERIALGPESATLALSTGEEVRARLVVLADGGANATKIPGIAFVEKDYRQNAVVASVATDRPHAGRAWERFTPHGPLALLPTGERYALVWTATPPESERLRALGDAAFVAELQGRFGDRAGRFISSGPRFAFPLRLRQVNTSVALRSAIVGNAAQALHPVAGQGLNLGLRDAIQLFESISAAHGDPGSAPVLASYREARRRDSRRGAAFTDLLVTMFADGRRIPTWGRGLALAALDVFPPARRLLAARMINGAPAP